MPLIRYRHPGAAVEWLQAALGFELRDIVKGTGGEVISAELAFGGVTVMVAPVALSAFDRLMKQPDEIGGAETQCSYLIVDDPDAHCATATTAGADIVIGLEDYASGGRGYTCRDPEGHIWHCGSFKFKSNAVPVATAAIPPQESVRQAHIPRSVLASLFVIAISPIVLTPGGPGTQSGTDTAYPIKPAEVAATAAPIFVTGSINTRRDVDRTVLVEAEASLKSMAEKLDTETRQRHAAERAISEALETLAAERTAAHEHERAKNELREAVVRAETERASALRDAAELRNLLDAAERDLQQKAEAAAALEAKYAEEQKKREAAEASATDAQSKLTEHQQSAAESGQTAAASVAQLDELRGAISSANERAAEAARIADDAIAAAESAEREAVKSAAAAETESRSKAQAWKIVSDLRNQIARKKNPSAAAKKSPAPSATDDDPGVEAVVAPKAGDGSGVVKDPPYSGPLSPF